MNNVESFVTTPHIYTIENIYVSFDSRLNNIESDVKELKQDVKILKSDVTELKSDVNELKNNIASLEKSIEQTNNNVRELTAIVIRNQRENEIHHQYANYIMGFGFAIMAVVVALVGLRKSDSASQYSHTSYYFTWPRKYIPWLRK